MKNTRLILLGTISFLAAAIILVVILFFVAYVPDDNNVLTQEPLRIEKETAIIVDQIVENRVLVSPYKNVDWENIDLYYGNFHTHTNLSDGFLSSDEVVALYADNNYQILSLTDHNTSTDYKTTFPWASVGVAKTNAGKLLALEGIEITEVDNIISLFSNYGGNITSEDQAITEINNKNGLAIMAHPGRYTKPLSFYIDIYNNHDNLIGFEVFNQKDRYPNDRDLWDRLLNEVMPGKNIWGFANDDMHYPLLHFGLNRNIFPLVSLSLESLRQSMEDGSFFFFHSSQSIDSPSFSIKSLSSTGSEIAVNIDGDYNQIDWFGFNPKTNSTESFSTSNSININDIPYGIKFVRFVIKSNTGDLYSQPFKILKD